MRLDRESAQNFMHFAVDEMKQWEEVCRYFQEYTTEEDFKDIVNTMLQYTGIAMYDLGSHMLAKRKVQNMSDNISILEFIVCDQKKKMQATIDLEQEVIREKAFINKFSITSRSHCESINDKYDIQVGQKLEIQSLKKGYKIQKGTFENVILNQGESVVVKWESVDEKDNKERDISVDYRVIDENQIIMEDDFEL